MYKTTTMTAAEYEIYAAAIDWDGLQLSSEPRARHDTLADALAASADPANHGPEGAAIVCPDGRVIYSAEEYDLARQSQSAGD